MRSSSIRARRAVSIALSGVPVTNSGCAVVVAQLAALVALLSLTRTERRINCSTVCVAGALLKYPTRRGIINIFKTTPALTKARQIFVSLGTDQLPGIEHLCHACSGRYINRTICADFSRNNVSVVSFVAAK